MKTLSMIHTASYLLLASLGLALSAYGADADPKAEASAKGQADPKAHAVIDRYIKAIGGEEALKKIETRVAKGEMAMPAQGLSITITMSQKAPNKVLVEQSIAGLMDATQAFNGTKGWSKDSLLGFRELEGAELEQLKRESNIRRELNLKKDYPVMKLLPDEEIDGRKMRVIEAEDEDGRQERWHFDAETNLLAKMKSKVSLGAQGEIEVTIVTKDYQEFDGVQIPMTSEIKNPAFSATMKLKSVEHDVPLDDKMFEAPDEE